MEDSDRLSRLETHTEHLLAEIGDVKSDVRTLRKDLSALAMSTEKGFAAAEANIAALAMSTEKAHRATEANIAALALSTEKGHRATEASIAALALSTEKSFAATHAAIAALALNREKADGRMRIWFFSMTAGLLAIMARAFHWI